MRKLLFGLCCVIGCGQNPAKKIEGYPALELISHHQLIRFDTLNFDLSSMVLLDKNVFVIADKPWNTFIYRIEYDSNRWSVVERIPFEVNTPLDLEAIDHCKDIYFVADENKGTIFSFKVGQLPVPLPVNFDTHQIKPIEWGNASWEGLAVDCNNNILYLIKERQPRFILAVDLTTLKIVDQFNIPETESNDFADAKFENAHLYLLERNGNYIAKVDPKTHEVIDKVHYRHIASHTAGKLYGPEKYGMAEALVLTDTEIWIGLDNNGKYVTSHAKNTYHLTGNEPVILKFKRPVGF